MALAVAQPRQAPTSVTPASRELRIPPPVDANTDTAASSHQTPAQVDQAVATTTVTLHVVRILDDELPPITDQDMATILKVAQATLDEKLGFGGVRFEDHGAVTVEEFFAANLDDRGACATRLGKWRYDPWSTPDFNAARPEMLRFLKRWKLKELRGFFPPAEAQALTSHQDLIDKLIPIYQSKVERIREMRLPNGNGLLAPAKAPLRSYVNWICAVRAQRSYDIILTNEFLLYDLITEPYPHSIFKKCKVGGASLRSPARTAMPGRALFASTFGMETSLPFFSEDPDHTLTREERQRVTGMFILAHELGHALFKLPDFYDHPPQCLMTTTAETDYLGGYQELLKHPGPCPACTTYVDTRRQYFYGRWLLAQGRYDEAVATFTTVAKETPKHIDGSYRAYLADIGLNIATAHHRAGRAGKARRWLRSARGMDPKNEQVQQRWQEWFAD